MLSNLASAHVNPHISVPLLTGYATGESIYEWTKEARIETDKARMLITKFLNKNLNGFVRVQFKELNYKSQTLSSWLEENSQKLNEKVWKDIFYQYFQHYMLLKVYINNYNMVDAQVIIY